MKKILLLISVFTVVQIVAQTSNCDDTPAGQIIPGASCVPQTFNSTNNTDYWDDAFFQGLCSEDDFDDAWMWFDAVSTTTTITYTPTNGDPILTIFQGACSPFASSVACSDNIGTVAETITMATIPGTRYHIRIQNWGSNANMNGNICVVGTTGGGATTASDCSLAVNVCTDLSFSVDPNGFGAINEIPTSGTTSNPSVNPASANFGCLLAGEYNSTWMVVNVATSGILEFVIGGLGAQTGYYDWIMYPYSGAASCAAIQANTLAPVRCNWNGVSSGGTGLANTIPGGGSPTNYEPGLSVTAGQQYIICFSNYSNLTTTVPLQFLNNVGNAGVSCTPLGFQLSGLTVSCENDFREISWSLPNINQVDFSVVQKSRDGVNWENMETVIQGLENGNATEFSVVDENDPTILSYYRVRQHLPDGDVIYSASISADCNDVKNPFEVYPNPTNGSVSIAYKSKQEVPLKISDLSGKVVLTTRLVKAPKRSTIHMEISDIPDGIYLIELELEGTPYIGKLIVSN